MSRHHSQSELPPILDAVAEVTKRCQDHCMGPEGPGGQIKAQVDKWRGGLSVGVCGGYCLATCCCGCRRCSVW